MSNNLKEVKKYRNDGSLRFHYYSKEESGQLACGLRKVFYNNGNLREIGWCNDGLRIGITKWISKHKHIFSMSTFKLGVSHGIYIGFINN